VTSTANSYSQDTVATGHRHAVRWLVLTARHNDPLGFARGELRDRVFKRDEERCLRCGAADDLQVDHVWPHSLGGPTKLSNLQTFCGRCNRLKGRTGRDYRPRRRERPALWLRVRSDGPPGAIRELPSERTSAIR
jgi:5-methylcytosine-specific restriction endonuclease McrA